MKFKFRHVNTPFSGIVLSSQTTYILACAVHAGKEKTAEHLPYSISRSRRQVNMLQSRFKHFEN
jgi:hypothetical protein